MNLRGKLATVLGVAETLAISVPTVIDALRGRLTRERVDARLSWWARGVVAAAKVEVSVEGRERVPSRPVIFMSNHGSHLDVPVDQGGTFPSPLARQSLASLLPPRAGRASFGAHA